MTSKEELQRQLSVALASRPVRWSKPENVVGDYEGRERTLEVFNADAGEQRSLLRKIRPLRAALEAVAGGPIITVFHTRAESIRLYADFISSALQADARADATASQVKLPSTMDALALDVPVGKGSTQLPRRAA